MTHPRRRGAAHIIWPFADLEENVPDMLLIACGLTVVLVAADLLDLNRRASARSARAAK